MHRFLDEDFLLENETAKRLYWNVAHALPIFDYHCHLSSRAIAEDQPFDDIAKMWLESDHYKWRIMRANGTPEVYCAGRGPWDRKFVEYAKALTKAAGNPLVQWSHLELRRIFGIEEVMTPENALAIRAKANDVLATRRISPRSLLAQFEVSVICTTDDPVDDLRWHKAIAAEQATSSAFKTKVLPTFRPDRVLKTEDIAAWNGYVDALSEAAGIEIHSFQTLAEAVSKRHDYFHALGSRLSDHALLVPLFATASDDELDAIVRKGRSRISLSTAEQEKLAVALLLHVARLNAKRGWTMQLHISALRNANPKLFSAFGPDTGGDCISDAPIANALASFLGQLEAEGNLPKTILYTLDPSKHTPLATIAGCFAGTAPDATASQCAGKVQLGAAWWFNDQKDGMERHMREYGGMGLLGAWVGMLTDSRSFMSFPRHEYFRRLLCTIVGEWVEHGELPDDPRYTDDLVRGICWENAVRYFGMT